MKKIKYFFEFLIISFLFIIYKFLGLKISSHISGKLFETFGPIFRSKNLIKTNIQRAIPKINLPRKLRSLQKICGIIMEEHCLNICFLKVLEMINLNQILI